MGASTMVDGIGRDYSRSVVRSMLVEAVVCCRFASSVCWWRLPRRELTS